MLTYTMVEGGVLAVDHCPHASALSLFGVMIAEAAYLLCIDFTHNFGIYILLKMSHTDSDNFMVIYRS